MALFGFGKKKDDTKANCCCRCTPESVEQAENVKNSSGIMVLGGGCAKCHELEANAKASVAQLGISDEVRLITDFSVIASYGMLSTPALIVDEKVVAYGKVLKTNEIVAILKQERGL